MKILRVSINMVEANTHGLQAFTAEAQPAVDYKPLYG